MRELGARFEDLVTDGSILLELAKKAQREQD
jgi:hypothetical protein